MTMETILPKCNAANKHLKMAPVGVGKLLMIETHRKVESVPRSCALPELTMWKWS